MAMKALVVSEAAIIRNIEPYYGPCVPHKVMMEDEKDMCVTLLGMCPFLSHPDMIKEAVYDIACILHGSEEGYLRAVMQVGL